jgi:hypothetical protein
MIEPRAKYVAAALHTATDTMTSYLTLAVSGTASFDSETPRGADNSPNTLFRRVPLVTHLRCASST